MTLEEAIEIIKLAQAQIEWDYPMDYVVAFDMAISALQAQDAPDINVGDMISRQAAIDFIDAGHLCNPNEPRWSDNEIVNFLKSRPSANPGPTSAFVDELRKGMFDTVTFDANGCVFFKKKSDKCDRCRFTFFEKGEEDDGD